MRSAVGALWPDEAIEAIHLASLELLERAGVRVESQAARTLLTRAGCREGHGGRLLMPRERGRRRRWPPCPRPMSWSPAAKVALWPSTAGPARSSCTTWAGRPTCRTP